MPTARTTLRLPRREQVGHLKDGLLAVAHDGRVDEVRHRLGVERRVPPGNDDRVVVAPVARMQWYAGQVQRGEQVGVAELGGEGDAEQVEVTQCAVPVNGELRDCFAPQQRLHVRPHGIRAFGEGIGAFVDDLVQDHDALVGKGHLIGIWVHQGPACGQLLAVWAEPAAVPVLDGGVELTADVLYRLAHLLQQRFEAVEQRDARSTGRMYVTRAFGHGFKGRARPAHSCTCRRQPCA